MRKMNLGQTLQILANAGVIAGIVFLGLELSQNTDAIRSQTVHSFQAEFRQIFDFPPVYVQSLLKDPADRTDEERHIRRAFFSRIMRIFENQWYQYSRGYLDEELFRAYQQHLRIALGNEDYARLWDSRKKLGFYHPGFVSHVDSFLAENPPYTNDEIAAR